MIRENCNGCGSLFDAPNRRIKFCSDACRIMRFTEQRKRYRGTTIPRPRRQSPNAKIRPCVHCGEKFLPLDNREKLCSDTCRVERLYEQRQGYREKRFVYKTYDPEPCAVCRKMFTPTNPNHITCSPPCRAVRVEINQRQSRIRRSSGRPTGRPRKMVCSARDCDTETNSTHPICREHLPRFDHEEGSSRGSEGAGEARRSVG